MDSNHNRAESALVGIAKEIDQQAYDESRLDQEWGGAGVLVTSTPRNSTENAGFYPEPRTVVTPFAGEVAWLFTRLRDAFDGLIDGASKIEFYGRLAAAATAYQQSINGNENAQDMLRAILHEGFVMLEEMEEGKFEYLMVAPGNMILGDLIDEAEKSGYLGTEATEEFLRRMEEKHREA
jgi:hypothetical protein